MRIRIFILTLAVFFTFACNNQQKKKEESIHNWMIEDNFNWIQLYEEHLFISNHNDTLRFEVTNKSETQESGGSSVGAPEFFDYTIYEYQYNLVGKIDSTVGSKTFLKLTTSSDDYAELELYFLNGKFDLITENYLVKIPKFKYKKKSISDVNIVTNKEINKDCYATKIWWSRANGIVKFITIDNKIWEKI